MSLYLFNRASLALGYYFNMEGFVSVFNVLYLGDWIAMKSILRKKFAPRKNLNLLGTRQSYLMQNLEDYHRAIRRKKGWRQSKQRLEFTSGEAGLLCLFKVIALAFCNHKTSWLQTYPRLSIWTSNINLSRLPVGPQSFLNHDC